MNDKIVYEKIIKYLNYLLKGQAIKTRVEMQEIKSIREYINGKMYQ